MCNCVLQFSKFRLILFKQNGFIWLFHPLNTLYYVEFVYSFSCKFVAGIKGLLNCRLFKNNLFLIEILLAYELCHSSVSFLNDIQPSVQLSLTYQS